MQEKNSENSFLETRLPNKVRQTDRNAHQKLQAGIDRFVFANISRSLYSCLKRSISSPCFLLQFSNSLHHLSLTTSVLSRVIFTRSNSSFVLFRSSIISFVCTPSYTLGLLLGTAVFSCELDEAASLHIF